MESRVFDGSLINQGLIARCYRIIGVGDMENLKGHYSFRAIRWLVRSLQSTDNSFDLLYKADNTVEFLIISLPSSFSCNLIYKSNLILTFVF